MAAQPGHTKDLQSVQLERGIKIVDSPGVVFDEDESSDSSQRGSILLRNVVKVEDIEDPIAVGGLFGTDIIKGWIANLAVSVEEILARTEPETLQKLYNLPQFSSTLEFLTMLALNSGRLLKVGFCISKLRHFTDITLGRYPRPTFNRTSHSHGLESPKNPLLLCPTYHSSLVYAFCHSRRRNSRAGPNPEFILQTFRARRFVRGGGRGCVW